MSATSDTRLLLFNDGRTVRDDQQAKIRRYRLARVQLSAKRVGDEQDPRVAHLKRAHD